MMAMHSRIEDGSLVPNGIDLPTRPEICSGGDGSLLDRCGLRALHEGAAARRRTRRDPRAARGDRRPDVRAVAGPADDSRGRPLGRPAAHQRHALAASAARPGAWACTSCLADVPGMRRAGTGDWAGLPNCYYWIDRSAGVCGAVLTQVFPFFDAAHRRGGDGLRGCRLRRGWSGVAASALWLAGSRPFERTRLTAPRRCRGPRRRRSAAVKGVGSLTAGAARHPGGATTVRADAPSPSPHSGAAPDAFSGSDSLRGASVYGRIEACARPAGDSAVPDVRS